MKYLILFILAGFVYGQVTFEAETWFNQDRDSVVLLYNNDGFVEYFRTIPPEWKEDLFNQNFVAKKQGYYELILKGKEWLHISLEDQQAGLIDFEVVPDPNLFAFVFLVMPFDTIGGDTNIVDFDSVSITTYFYGVDLEPDTTFEDVHYPEYLIRVDTVITGQDTSFVNVTVDTTITEIRVVLVTVLPDKKPKKEKFTKKQNGNIDYPTNLVNFPSKADRKIYLKEQKKIKKEKKDK